jgi:type III pantothenate kinase
LNGVNSDEIDAIIISSVVPPVMPTLERMCQRYFGLTPLVIGPGVKTGMDIKYDNPREVGADRIVNAVAAYEKFGGPVIIIDFGTATTFCAVDKKGTYLGGAICPGIGISTDALVQRTAKLPRIEVVRTDKVICRNTVESMQAGVFYGFVGQVDGIVARMRKELGCKAKVVATGGLAVIVAPATDAIDVVEPMLTLEGLRIIYDRNR